MNSLLMRDGLADVGEVLSVHGLAGADAIWCSKDLQPPAGRGRDQHRIGGFNRYALHRCFL